MFYIENDVLKIAIEAKGAELKSIYNKVNQLEYMWSGDPAFWSKTSPVLFPIIGALKDNAYIHKGQRYQLPRHGFARDKTFQVRTQDNNSISFAMESNEETQKVYPFSFSFLITYRLNNNELSVNYNIRNKGSDIMLFSIGGHPAFKVPLAADTTYNDYELVFEKSEDLERWLVSKEGLIEKGTRPLLSNTNMLKLDKELFKDDAIVLKNLSSTWVQLHSPKTTHGLKFMFQGFPFLGLWAAPGADFLCIEPWCGIADSVDTNQQFSDKEGILQLEPSAGYNVQWKASFY